VAAEETCSFSGPSCNLTADVLASVSSFCEASGDDDSSTDTTVFTFTSLKSFVSLLGMTLSSSIPDSTCNDSLPGTTSSACSSPAFAPSLFFRSSSIFFSRCCCKYSSFDFSGSVAAEETCSFSGPSCNLTADVLASVSSFCEASGDDDSLTDTTVFTCTSLQSFVSLLGMILSSSIPDSIRNDSSTGTTASACSSPAFDSSGRMSVSSSTSSFVEASSSGAGSSTGLSIASCKLTFTSFSSAQSPPPPVVSVKVCAVKSFISTPLFPFVASSNTGSLSDANVSKCFTCSFSLSSSNVVVTAANAVGDAKLA